MGRAAPISRRTADRRRRPLAGREHSAGLCPARLPVQDIPKPGDEVWWGSRPRLSGGAAHVRPRQRAVHSRGRLCHIHSRYDAWSRLGEAWADDAGQPGPSSPLPLRERAGGEGVSRPGDPDDLIARYTYDGRGYRIAKAVALYEGDPGQITGYDRTDYYYNDSWQVLKERFEADAEPATELCMVSPEFWPGAAPRPTWRGPTTGW